jgi:hypothetical protein
LGRKKVLGVNFLENYCTCDCYHEFGKLSLFGIMSVTIELIVIIVYRLIDSDFPLANKGGGVENDGYTKRKDSFSDPNLMDGIHVSEIPI